MHDEILRHGLNLDKLTYNTLILACVESEKLDVAMQFFEGMKVSSLNSKGQFRAHYLLR